MFNGVVSKIGAVMSETSRSFTVEARLVNRPPLLFPNLTVEANIVIRTKKNALTIPRNYLVADKYVLLKNNKKKEIVCGLRDYQEVEIISGLKPGEIILKPME
ncbi:multidrug efflux system subunit MdtA [compost metagenome]